jgi:hypothetical protein
VRPLQPAFGGQPHRLPLRNAAKYGEAETLALELDNAAHKWSREEVRGIRDDHRAKVKQLKREAAL